MRYFNVNKIFSLMFLGILILQNPCFSMEEFEDSKFQSSQPKALDLKQMSYEELLQYAQKLTEENLALKQVTNGMDPQEQEVAKILGMELPETARSLVVILEKCGDKSPINLEQAIYDIDIDEGPRTFGEVLRDKKISENTARKVFRGLLTAIKEEGSLNFRSYSFSKIQPEKRFETCLVDFLCREYHVVKVFYPIGSLTDYLIRKYSLERTGSIISETRTHRFAMF